MLKTTSFSTHTVITDLNDWKVCAYDVNMSDESKEPTFSEQKEDP